jgi:hypothetical protein
MIKAALILAVAIIVGGFLAGGRYATSGSGNAGYIVDRYTGSITVCVLVACRKIENSD